MKARIVAALITCLALTVYISPVLAAPKLEIADDSFDFGFVPENTKVSHVFQLRNSGDDDLKIIKVITGCGCTKAPLIKRKLAPGETSEQEFTFNTRGYKTKITKRLRIETNAGKPDAFFNFTARVIKKPDETFPLRIQPDRIDILQTEKAIRDEISFTLTNLSDQPIIPKLVDKSTQMFAVELPARVDPGKHELGKLILRPGTSEKSFTKSFTIELDDEKRTRYTIPVKQSGYRKPSKTSTD